MPQQQTTIEHALTPGQLQAALEALYPTQQAVCIWGPPGIGKSAVVRQLTERRQVGFIDVRLPLLDAVDLRGLPYNDASGITRWSRPNFIPSDGAGVVFLDELNRAPTMTQNGALQLIHDRRSGEHDLGDGWVTWAACNGENDGGGVAKMPAALAKRFVHLYMRVDVDDWCKWALQHGLDNMLIAFMRFRPELLHSFEPREKSFPTPRSWEFVSKVLSQGATPEIEFALVAGAVGQAAAVEFTAFARLYRSLPSIDAILLDPANTTVPSDVSTRYAVASALARKADDTNFSRVLTYLDRLPVEYAAFAVKDAVSRDPSLPSTPDFTRWAVTHAHIF